MTVNALYLYAVINWTAAREERDLAAHFGAEYQRYMSRTGRFFPNLGAAEVQQHAHQQSQQLPVQEDPHESKAEPRSSAHLTG
jgi:hypothetical protein